MMYNYHGGWILSRIVNVNDLVLLFKDTIGTLYIWLDWVGKKTQQRNGGFPLHHGSHNATQSTINTHLITHHGLQLPLLVKSIMVVLRNGVTVVWLCDRVKDQILDEWIPTINISDFQTIPIHQYNTCSASLAHLNSIKVQNSID